MARCGDCNKFVSFDTDQDPEIEVEVAEGTVQVTARIVNACADCGSELRESTLEMDAEVPESFAAHVEAGVAALGPGADDVARATEEERHELEAEDAGDGERMERSEGTGRGTRTFYGARVTVKMTCSCGAWSADVEVDDEVQASAMEEC